MMQVAESLLPKWELQLSSWLLAANSADAQHCQHQLSVSSLPLKFKVKFIFDKYFLKEAKQDDQDIKRIFVYSSFPKSVTAQRQINAVNTHKSPKLTADCADEPMTGRKKTAAS